MSFKVEKKIGGKVLSIETGKMARLADASALVRYGDTVVLVTVVTSKLKEEPSFLPLSVEYREKTFAAGKFPGGFYKREGRPSTKEILTMRLIDRPHRPLFPEGYSSEIQVMVHVLSADQENDPDIPSMIGASAALSLAGLPIDGPTGSVRVGRIDNQLVLNPTHQQTEQSDLELVVTGTEKEIVMVEGGAKEIKEQDLVEAIFWGHEQILQIIELQKELVAKVGVEKETAPPPSPLLEKAYQLINNKIRDEVKNHIQTKGKKNRGNRLSEYFDEVKEKFLPSEEEQQNSEEELIQEKHLKAAYERIKREIARDLISQGKRIDGRGLNEVRPVSCEVGLLPRAHGSALFTRGETQALVTTTLGTSRDEQIVDGLKEEYKKSFLLHYNFPPFSVGEVKPIRGVSRREIGHGALAERALAMVIPNESRFPYTTRIVSETLDSNGSSSMAAVSGGTLALMDAGVPIKKPVGGIAMGLVKEKGQFFILSDIMGEEDKFGDMDFKVAGTQRGITAVQMDIKTDGISREILTQALEQAREGRIHILRQMILTLDRPRKEISAYAPRVVRIQVPIDKIPVVIGPGGKNIRQIQQESKASLEIDDTGTVTIYCPNKEGAAFAQELIEKLTQEIKVGEIYEGKVTATKDFGAFVEIAPGVEGLVHVSELAKSYVQNVSDEVRIGDQILVKVLAVDDQNRIKLSKKAAEQQKSK